MLINAFIFLLIVVTFLLVTLVLVQPGKGFGLESAQSGASRTVFGSSGPRKIQRKMTVILFVIWLLLVLALGSLISRARKNLLNDVLEERASTQDLIAELRQEAQADPLRNSAKIEPSDPEGASEDHRGS